MARTVKVALVAEVGQYKRGMGEAERATDKVSDSLAGIDGAPLDAAAKKAKGLGDAADAAADRAKKDFDEAARHAKKLDDQIRDTETGMRSLAKAFASTGDPKILAAWKEQGRVLGDLKNIRKALPDPGEAVAAGISLGQRLGAGLTKAIPPQMTTAIVAGGIAASPFLAATLVGAISGSAGFAGIGAGVALALQDPHIKAEAKGLADFIGAQMRSSGGAFGPAMIDALGTVRTKVSDLRNEFDRILSNSARYLNPLTESLTRAVGNIVEGLDRVIASAGPTLGVIGEGIEGIAEQAELFLNMVADNSSAGAKALSDLFNIIEFGMRGLTIAVDLLARAYEFGTAWTQLIPGMGNDAEDFGKKSEQAGAGAGILGKAVEETGKKAAVAKVKFVALEEILQTIAGRNIGVAESMISLRESIKAATDAIDKKSKVSDAELTALLGLASATNSTTAALDEQGRTVEAATKAHEANRKKLIEVAIKMGYPRAEAKKLADQYLATPKGVSTVINQPGMKKSREDVRAYHGQLDKVTRQIKTSVTVTGDKAAYAKLEKLLIAQQAAAKGITVSAASAAFRKQERNAYHGGGWTGPGGTYDEAGVVHADEFVVKKSSRQRIERRHPGLLAEMNATGQVPGYAVGGIVAPFRVNASITKIMSMAEALSKVTPAFGSWPSSPGAQRGDSGVWRQIAAMIRATGPMSGSFGNGYRPGDPKWHGSGRAVDWMGFNQDRLARFLAAKKPLELIHRTNSRDYAYTRGRNMGSFNNALMQAHRNHIHIAMANGGVIPEPVIGFGASGASYSFGERGPERVLSHGQTMAAARPVVVQVPAPAGRSGPLVGPVYVQNRTDADMIANQLQFRLQGV